MPGTAVKRRCLRKHLAEQTGASQGERLFQGQDPEQRSSCVSERGGEPRDQMDAGGTRRNRKYVAGRHRSEITAEEGGRGDENVKNKA